MNTSKTSTKSYIVTFATLLALPFAVQAGGYTADQDRTAESTTRVGANAENTTHATADTATQTIAITDAVTTGPLVDGPSRSANGVARVPNEMKAAARDVANSPQREHIAESDVVVGHAHVAADGTHSTSGSYGVTHKSRVDLNNDDAIGMQLNTDAATKNIETTDFANRDLAVTLAESGVTEGKQIVSTIRSSSTAASDEVRKDLDRAIHKVEKAEKKLNKAIVSSRNATESRWDDVRDQLADRYEDYADSLENAREVAIDGGMHFETQIGMVDSDRPTNRS